MKKLKSAEEIYNTLIEECPWTEAISKKVIKPYILAAIEMAQTNTIEATVERCVEEAYAGRYNERRT
jgi:hypothetical protein